MSDEPRPLKLLLVEDSEDDELLLLRALKKGGYKVRHTRVQSADEMRRALLNEPWDLVISDYNLPQFSALAALEVYHEVGLDLPFIIVSGTVGEETSVTALRSGAHDFLIKGKFSRLGPAIERELKEAGERRARREAESALLDSQRRFRSLIENSSDIITVVGADGRIIYASPSLKTVLGYEPERAVGKALEDLAHPSDRELIRDVLAELLEHDGESRTVEFRLKDEHGSWLVLEAIGKSMASDPVVGGIVVNSRDITQRKAAESRLKAANEELRQAQQQLVRRERLTALGEMASGIAHDFNNALSSILGFSEALLMYPDILEDQEQALELIRMINVSAQDGAQVVERLGEFYRTKERPEDLESLDLNLVVDQAVRLTQPRWKGQARSAGLQIEVGIEPGDIPKAKANAAELRQALTNLIFNATDAMPEGGRITLRTQARPESGEVCVEISDTGTGMSEDTRSRCLEPFFTTKGQKGTGMGLAMVYGIIRRHSGMIEVDSKLGEGTTFRILLPIGGPSPGDHADVVSDPALGSGALRVLVVEEEPFVRTVVSTFLASGGHDTELAADGVSALDMIRASLKEETPYNMIIASRSTPEMSGEQLALAAKELLPETPVILMTGVNDGAALSGVDVTVTKPFTLETFRRALSQAVQSGG